MTWGEGHGVFVNGLHTCLLIERPNAQRSTASCPGVVISIRGGRWGCCGTPTGAHAPGTTGLDWDWDWQLARHGSEQTHHAIMHHTGSAESESE